MAHHLVYKVNGKIVNNLKDLIHNMETHQGDIHLIETQDHEMIVLKKLLPVELKKIMDAHKIAFDRSEDLRPGSKKKNVLALCEDSSTDSLSSMSVQGDAEPNEPAEKVVRRNHSSHGRHAMFASQRPIGHGHKLLERGSVRGKKLSGESDDQEENHSLKRHKAEAESDFHESAYQF
jgi:hypothetical protein